MTTAMTTAVWNETKPGVWERASEIDVDRAHELTKERLETLWPDDDESADDAKKTSVGAKVARPSS